MAQMSNMRFLPENGVETVMATDVSVGVMLELDSSVAHTFVQASDLREALGVSRVQFDGAYHIVVTLPEGKRWNSEYEHPFGRALSILYGHRFEFVTSDALIH